MSEVDQDEAVVEGPICPRCGEPGNPGARACKHCGRNYNSRWWWTLAIVTAVVIGMVWFMIQETNDSQRKAEREVCELKQSYGMPC